MVEVGGSVPNAGRKVEEMSCFSGWQAPGFAYGRIFLLRLDRGPAHHRWKAQGVVDHFRKGDGVTEVGSAS